MIKMMIYLDITSYTHFTLYTITWKRSIQNDIRCFHVHFFKYLSMAQKYNNVVRLLHESQFFVTGTLLFIDIAR